jgi:hypothetical protein
MTALDDNVTQVLETVARFHDENSNKTKAFYDVKITVKTRLYETGAEYYDIGYNYNFHPEELKDPDDILYFRKVIHPFYQEDQQGKYGEIIRKNKMTTCMIEFLLKSDEALRKEAGTSTPQRYRSDIIHSLAKLWD